MPTQQQQQKVKENPLTKLWHKYLQAATGRQRSQTWYAAAFGAGVVTWAAVGLLVGLASAFSSTPSAGMIDHVAVFFLGFIFGGVIPAGFAAVVAGLAAARRQVSRAIDAQGGYPPAGWRTAGRLRRHAAAAPARHRQPAADLGDERSLEEVLAELDDLPGLSHVAEQVRGVARRAEFDRRRAEHGMGQPAGAPHLVFIGPPGTGKTTIARIYSEALKAIGVLPSGHLVETDRSGMVAGYVGQTAEKVQEKIADAPRRGAVHRRGLLAHSAGAGLQRLRPGGSRRPLEGDGGPARPAGGDRRRLRVGDGPLFGFEPGAAGPVRRHDLLRQLRPGRVDRYLSQDVPRLPARRGRAGDSNAGATAPHRLPAERPVQCTLCPAARRRLPQPGHRTHSSSLRRP